MTEQRIDEEEQRSRRISYYRQRISEERADFLETTVSNRLIGAVRSLDVAGMLLVVVACHSMSGPLDWVPLAQWGIAIVLSVVAFLVVFVAAKGRTIGMLLMNMRYASVDTMEWIGWKMVFRLIWCVPSSMGRVRMMDHDEKFAQSSFLRKERLMIVHTSQFEAFRLERDRNRRKLSELED